MDTAVLLLDVSVTVYEVLTPSTYPFKVDSEIVLLVTSKVSEVVVPSKRECPIEKLNQPTSLISGYLSLLWSSHA